MANIIGNYIVTYDESTQGYSIYNPANDSYALVSGGDAQLVDELNEYDEETLIRIFNQNRLSSKRSRSYQEDSDRPPTKYRR